MPLSLAVKLWSTVAAHEGRLGFQDRTRGKKGTQVNTTTQAIRWAGAMQSPSKDVTALSDSSREKSQKRGLNPRFGLWLMGFPVEWFNFAASATP